MSIAFIVIVVVFVVAVLGFAFVAPLRRRRARPGVEPGPGTTAPPLTRPSEAQRPPTHVLTPEEAAAEADAVLEEAEAILEEAEVVDQPVAPPPVKPRFRDRLGKARSLLSGYVGSILSRSTIDDETWDELEEALVRADVGVAATTTLLDDLRERVKSEGITTPQELVQALKDDLKKSLAPADRGLRYEPGAPNVWLFVGVNGVGKTTTIGKVANQQKSEGRSVILAAGDTFRAAAAEQLELWAHRVDAPLVRGAEGGDPSSVVFDAVERAQARNIDVVLADTAGRLHTKTNLMEELGKIRRVAERPPGRVTEVLLVIDATTGQNGLVQARQFAEAVDVTGIVLTKLDGTAKGGIALAIQNELNIPIKLVGLGETVEDLVEFDPAEFVEALFE
ncbi:MAG TPA: signal recognition particle-docking protein FtsY [Acidimicrobiales bacterium]|jgi:fused signal recognition particle receptor|nr:signal recognition particle-docking protein FtsY [Acidimicrobiales bacterium]